MKWAVIMAGGRGERFWPWSRNDHPKQFLRLLGERSLLQQTWDRLEKIFGLRQILVVTGQDFVSLVREHLPHLPEQNIIAEPVGRNTAPCIGLAAMRLKKEYPEAVMLVLPADHMIKEEKSFLRCLERALEFAAREDCLVTIGIIPTRPETGYGYIKTKGEPLGQDPPVYRVERFVEKPDREKALEYLSLGGYFWNSGIFAWKAGLILEKIRKYLPDLYLRLEDLEPYLGTNREEEMLYQHFPGMPNISIDYGVMEKDDSIYMVEGDFGWDDLGSWLSLEGHFPRDKDKNAKMGRHLGLDTRGCIIYGEKDLIATLGVSDLVIVQSKGVVLVCAKDRSQEIKSLVQKIKERGLEEYL